MERIILIIIIAFNFSFSQGIINLSGDEKIFALAILFGLLLWWAYNEGFIHNTKKKTNSNEEE